MTKDNKENLEMYQKLWSEIKNQIEGNSVKCNSVEYISVECNSIEYGEDLMKINFDAYDEDLPYNIWFSDLNIIVESVFQIKDKYYPQIYIHRCECEE